MVDVVNGKLKIELKTTEYQPLPAFTAQRLFTQHPFRYIHAPMSVYQISEIQTGERDEHSSFPLTAHASYVSRTQIAHKSPDCCTDISLFSFKNIMVKKYRFGSKNKVY